MTDDNNPITPEIVEEDTENKAEHEVRAFIACNGRHRRASRCGAGVRRRRRDGRAAGTGPDRGPAGRELGRSLYRPFGRLWLFGQDRRQRQQDRHRRLRGRRFRRHAMAERQLRLRRRGRRELQRHGRPQRRR